MEHASDCAVHNAPASEIGRCDCMGVTAEAQQSQPEQSSAQCAPQGYCELPVTPEQRAELELRIRMHALVCSCAFIASRNNVDRDDAVEIAREFENYLKGEVKP